MNYQTTAKNPYFIYGFHTVMAALRFQAKRCKRLVLARKEGCDDLITHANALGIPHQLIERKVLEKRYEVGSDAQGVVLICEPFPYCQPEDLLSATKIVILDSWQDAANIGRAARAALCFGASGLIICKDRSASINAAAEKSAVGALSRIKVAKVVNLAAAIQKFKAANFFIYGADEKGEVELSRCDFAQRSAIVIGQEGEGLRSLIKKSCDVLVRVPMSEGEICLNAADTALLFLYQLSTSK